MIKSPVIGMLTDLMYVVLSHYLFSLHVCDENCIDVFIDIYVFLDSMPKQNTVLCCISSIKFTLTLTLTLTLKSIPCHCKR